MHEEEMIKDAVLFLIKQNEIDPIKLDPAKLVAILYVADIYHLLLYGRTIIDSIKNTKYMLMEIEDMEKLCKELEGASSDYPYLSETDKEALKFALERYQIDYFQSIPMCFGIKE